ncbi:MAG: STAS domain-containing protein [Lentisphaerae bacterium]|nr:STAS domain-containing protein [Lentisphaerota bacterium]
MHSLEPKLLTVIREGYTAKRFLSDFTAGIVVAIIALPLAIAFAIASGVAPERGIYTAIIGGFLISALGGSRVQIGGPTGAFIVLIYGIVAQYGYEGLAVATLLAGGLLIAMGLARLGSVIQYVPYPVTLGFTTGIAIIIAASQVRDALGLAMESVPSAFIAKWPAYYHVLNSINILAVMMTIATVLILVALPRLAPRIPRSIVALVVFAACTALFDLPVDTIGHRFGAVPNTLPSFHIPRVSWDMLPNLISPAFSIALLAAIESLLSASVADGMTGRRHRPNAELVAQGIANVASPLWGGIPATGAIARTATNIKSGGTTPVAGIVHALALLLILVVAGRWVALVPMPVLAGILLVVAYRMSEMHMFTRVLVATTKGDALVMLSTFALTVIVDLAIALQVGVVLAALLFMRRMVQISEVKAVTMDNEEDAEVPPEEAALLAGLPKEVTVFEVSGPFFFGATQKFASAMSVIKKEPSVLILRMRRVPIIDATGLLALEAVHAQLVTHGSQLILSGLPPHPYEILIRSNFIKKLGPHNAVASFEAAVNRAHEILKSTEDEGGARPCA